MNKTLELCNIHKHFQVGNAPVLHILKGVDFRVRNEAFVSIQGPSGCGKSTLLYIMGGLTHSSRGEVLWNGENIEKWRNSKLALWRNRSLGFIFQSYFLLPELSVLENVLLPAALGKNKNGTEERATELLKKVGLQDRMKHRPAELSGGEQQRVAIARALINDPELILADEPTGNLDQATSRKVFQLLLDLIYEKKKTLIMVTHDSGLAEQAEGRFSLNEGILEKIS